MARLDNRGAVDKKTMGDSHTNGGWMDLLWQLAWLPVGMFTAALRATAAAIESGRRLPGAGSYPPLAAGAHAGPGAPPAGSAPSTDLSSTRPARPGARTPSKEERKMADTNLADDMVKLVRYSIVSIKRDEEEILQTGGEKLVTDNMDDESFANWVITDYFATAGHKPIESKDRKYLRVYHEVLRRWAKQDRKYEQRQLTALSGIQRVLEERL